MRSCRSERERSATIECHPRRRRPRALRTLWVASRRRRRRRRVTSPVQNIPRRNCKMKLGTETETSTYECHQRRDEYSPQPAAADIYAVTVQTKPNRAVENFAAIHVERKFHIYDGESEGMYRRTSSTRAAPQRQVTARVEIRRRRGHLQTSNGGPLVVNVAASATATGGSSSHRLML